MNPGSIFNNMPPQSDDPARKQRDLERQAREQAAARVGQAMQIGAGGILVNGGGGITIQAPGTLNVGGGILNSAGAITAATDITAGGNVFSGNGAAEMSSAGAITGSSLGVSGTVSGSNVTGSGRVSSNGAPFLSVPSHNYNVTSGYVACWINSDGQFGTSASSELVKKSLTPMTADDARRLLNLTPYWGRYVWDDDASPQKVFFLAEDVQAAGFGPDVAPVVEGEPRQFYGPDGELVVDATGTPVSVPVGTAYTVNYSQMVVPLIAAWHDGATQMQAMQATITALQTQVTVLEARLTAAGIA